MFYNPTLTWALRGLLAIGALATLYVVLVHPDKFATHFAIEDGPIEYATAALLFFAAFILGTLALRVTGLQRGLLAFYTLAFFWAAGEEISWGQRIFGIQSSEFFLEHNEQGETNLHNLVVGGSHLAEFVFGSLLALVIMTYLVVLPLLYGRVGWITRFVDLFAGPVPAKHIGILAIAATLFAGWIDLNRQWEVYEFAFSVFVCLIFLNPVNGHVFNLNRPDQRSS